MADAPRCPTVSAAADADAFVVGLGELDSGDDVRDEARMADGKGDARVVATMVEDAGPDSKGEEVGVSGGAEEDKREVHLGRPDMDGETVGFLLVRRLFDGFPRS